MGFFDKIFEPVSNLGKGVSKSMQSFGHTLDKGVKSIGHAFEDIGSVFGWERFWL